VISERERAWSDLLDATPPGWYVGQPSYHDERREWLLYAFDPSERAVVGVRKWERTAVAPTEVEAVITLPDGNAIGRPCSRSDMHRSVLSRSPGPSGLIPLVTGDAMPPLWPSACAATGAEAVVTWAPDDLCRWPRWP
jgi:hypothetical protein